MGSQPCCACKQQPSEPALCLRCGAVVCCGSRRCHGPAQQGMCYSHALACGGGTCAFLLLKMTRLLVIRKNRWAGCVGWRCGEVVGARGVRGVCWVCRV